MSDKGVFQDLPAPKLIRFIMETEFSMVWFSRCEKNYAKLESLYSMYRSWAGYLLFI